MLDNCYGRRQCLWTRLLLRSIQSNIMYPLRTVDGYVFIALFGYTLRMHVQQPTGRVKAPTDHFHRHAHLYLRMFSGRTMLGWAKEKPNTKNSRSGQNFQPRLSRVITLRSPSLLPHAHRYLFCLQLLYGT
jgi:hypothetical protein